MLLRKVMLGVIALAFPIGMVSVALTPSLASASVPNAAKTGKGNYSCSNLTGSIKFDPPLTLSATGTSDTATVTDNGSGCSGGKPAVTSSAGTAKFTLDSDNCSALESSGTTFTVTITYTNGAKSSSYDATSSSSTSSSGVITFSTTGPVTGSYKSSDATSTATIKQKESGIVSACGKAAGLKSLTIKSGSTSDF